MPRDIDVHAPTAARALSRWDAATSGIARVCQEGSARIQRLADATPWGDDAAGAAFHAAYTKDGGPEILAQIGALVVQDVEALGAKVRTAVGNTRGTDTAQAAGTTMSI
ncbi:hypothetical protein ACFFWE_27820 [Sphaerisporangium melleum]|uniref:hypothetical protein n=1 Tax=Sphaerisporangium melleum TaxID=321316 RepID=UPI001668D54E|nr:hypothetical protein [Sphaerisporangium melleum]